MRGRASMWKGRLVTARVGGDRYRIIGGPESYFGHTPGEVADELDQLHGEIMSFGISLRALAEKDEQAKLSSDATVQQARANELAAKKVMESFRPLVDAVERVKAKIATDADSSPYIMELHDAQLALDTFMPVDKRHEAVIAYKNLADERAALERAALERKPTALETWERNTWQPFFDTWMKLRELKQKPAQTWPLSGTWDRIQEYRQQFRDLYDRAPFKPSGPRPLDPRKDPSLFGDLGSVVKWSVIGVLALGGVFVLSSVVTNVKQGRDPVEHYVGLYRGKRAAGR